MTRRMWITLVLAVSLCLGSQALAGGIICTLPAGTDVFLDTEGVGEIPVPGFPGLLPFFVCGPTTIVRGDPVPGPGTDECTIPTEIVSMSLTGVLDPCGTSGSVPIGGLPITISIPAVTLPPLPLSLGAVFSDPSGGLPATSFFDVFSEVKVGSGPLPPPFLHVVDSLAAVPALVALPPGSESPGGPECVMPGDDVYEKGFPAHKHVPCPPKLCCQLPCGFRVHVSLRSCQEFGGFPTPEHCQPLCPGNVSVQQETWGKTKQIYR